VTWSGRDDDGHPLVQENVYGGKGSAPFFLQHQYGTYSRPHDPAPGNNGIDAWCTLLVAQDGSTYIGQLGSDPRFIGLIPLPPKGSQMNYVGFPDPDDPKKWKASFAYMGGDDGSWHYFRPAKDKGKDSALAVRFGVDGAGENVIELRHPDGSLVSLFDGSIVLKSPNGKAYVQVSDDGIVLRGNITLAGGISHPGGVPLTRGPEFAVFASNVVASLQATNAAIKTLSPLTALLAGTPPELAAAAATMTDSISCMEANVPRASDAAATAQTEVIRAL
jgi:hypothetical protein